MLGMQNIPMRHLADREQVIEVKYSRFIKVWNILSD